MTEGDPARDPRAGRLKWRRLLAEAVGTFFLVLVAAGAVVVNVVSHGQVGRAGAEAGPGIMVLALIYTIGETSGAHINPAVTVAFAARGHFPWRRVPGYLLAQVCGAVGAAGLLRLMFGAAGRLGGTSPGRGVQAWTALVMEIVLTAGLMTVVLGTACGSRIVGHNAAIAVGGYVVLSGLWASPVSGASMNPARSLGPALVSGDLSVMWIYAVGPLAGGLLAVGLAWALRGRPSLAADVAAQGDGEDDSSAANSGAEGADGSHRLLVAVYLDPVAGGCPISGNRPRFGFLCGGLMSAASSSSSRSRGSSRWSMMSTT